MQIEPIESFEQQNLQPKKSLWQHNIALVKKYFINAPVSIFGWIIMLIMFIISVIYTYTESKYYRGGYSITQLNPVLLKSLGANIASLVKQGEVYRLVTAIFLHAGLVHFFMNSISIFGLLMLNEQKYKFAFFLAAFLGGGIQGNLFSAFICLLRNKGNVVAIGASTSICAILGLNLATMYLDSLRMGNIQNVKKKIGFTLGYLLVVSLLPKVDFFGHSGSLISGALIGLSFNCLKIQLNQQPPLVKRISVIAKILLAAYTILLFLVFVI